MIFVTWTQFEIPDSVFFNIGIPHHVNPEYDNVLTDALKLLVHAPGHGRSSWGRVSERPKKIILVSSWDSEDSFLAFKARPEYLQYWTTLSDISSIAPVEQQVEPTFSWPDRLRGNIDIFTISVPSPISDDARAQLKELSGLQRSGGVGLGKQHLSPYGFPPTKVWLRDAHVEEGMDVETMLHICWWGSEKKEQEFKEYLTPGDGRTRLEKFEEHARSAGAISVREEHCNFVQVGDLGAV